MEKNSLQTGDALQEHGLLVSGRSPLQDGLRRFRTNKAAMAALIALVSLVIFSFSSYLHPYSYSDIDWDISGFSGPSLKACPPFSEVKTQDKILPNGQIEKIAEKSKCHFFGTDSNGRDLFVRTMSGIRFSIMIGLIATLIAFFVGILYGAVSGYAGGLVDTIMMRVVDVLYAIPFMFLVILLMALFKRSTLMIFVALGLVEWLTMARIMRGQTITLKNREFIEAAVAAGASRMRIILRHIVPNSLGVVIAYATLLVPAVIMTESFLSFLGLGTQEPQASLGNLISEGKDNMESAFYALAFPALFLSMILLCFNLIGDGLRDAFDPKDR